MIDRLLSSLPRRKTDKAIIVRCQDGELGEAQVFKLNANLSDSVLLLRQVTAFLLSVRYLSECALNRQNGYEYQYRFACPRCKLPIGYQVTPPPVKSGAFLYILSGALTQVQGQVPQDAFDLSIQYDGHEEMNIAVPEEKIEDREFVAC